MKHVLLSEPNLLGFCVFANLEAALHWKGVVGPKRSDPCHCVNVSCIDHWQNPTLYTDAAVYGTHSSMILIQCMSVIVIQETNPLP